MRRLFIIRKDLHLSGGKLAAMVGHCCEAYWTNILKKYHDIAREGGLIEIAPNNDVQFKISLDFDIFNQYVNGIFTKTICEAKNRNQLMKIVDMINDYNAYVEMDSQKLYEGIDYGFINDCCLTELTPENDDGTTTIGVWFKPLPDDVAHRFSKKYKLYRD